MNRWLLLAGDVLMLLVFALMGQASHKVDITVAETLKTALPFIVGWLLTGWGIGIYKLIHFQSVSAILKRTVLNWVIAIPLGLVLRAWILGTGFSVPFLFVSMAFTLLLLSAWRLAFVAVAKRIG